MMKDETVEEDSAHIGPVDGGRSLSLAVIRTSKQSRQTEADVDPHNRDGGFIKCCKSASGDQTSKQGQQTEQ